MNIEIAKNNNAPNLGKIIGNAFSDDPVSYWAFGSKHVIRQGYESLISNVYIPRGHCTVIDNVAGAAWLMPGGKKNLPISSTVMLGLAMMLQVHPRHMVRSLLLDYELQKRRPRVPHMYLFAVGVAEAHRGKGIGQKIVQATLDECDAQGLPAFLENTNPANHSFYLKLGFEAGETYSPADGCPPVTPMWRPARPPADRAA